MFFLQKIAWMSYMIGVYMKRNSKQDPCMYYDANTQTRRRNSDMTILIFLSTETSHLDGTVAYDQRKT